MSSKQRRTKGMLLLFLLIALSLLSACGPVKNNGENNPGSEYKSGIVTISGSGVEQEISFKLDELKRMEEAHVNASYSAVNNWPAKKFFVARGIELSYLLEQAGIKTNAETIILTAYDAYYVTFTRDQLEEKRYYFPKLLKGSEEGAEEVPAILAWEYGEGIDGQARVYGGKLTLFLGQKGLNDVLAPAYVKDVVRIEVLAESPGQWDMVQAQPEAGKVEKGTEVVLKHPMQDMAKIYYTIDGSTPDVNSIVYNPSTSYFQPELNKPITIEESLIIEAVVIGPGKYNSRVASFAYEVE